MSTSGTAGLGSPEFIIQNLQPSEETKRAFSGVKILSIYKHILRIVFLVFFKGQRQRYALNSCGSLFLGVTAAEVHEHE